MRYQINRGDIWLVDLPMTNTSIQGMKRPCIIVSNEEANCNSPVIHIVPLTNIDNNKNKIPTHITVGVNTGIKMDSIALVEQSMLISKNTLIRKVGECDTRTMNKIETAILVQFGLYQKIKNIIDNSRKGVTVNV